MHGALKRPSRKQIHPRAPELPGTGSTEHEPQPAFLDEPVDFIEQTGKPLPGARVLIIPVRQNAVTDAYGIYRIDDVPFGPSKLYVSQEGYATQTVAFNITKQAEYRYNIDLVRMGEPEEPDVAQVGLNTLAWISEKLASNGPPGGATSPDPSPPEQADTSPARKHIARDCSMCSSCRLSMISLVWRQSVLLYVMVRGEKVQYCHREAAMHYVNRGSKFPRRE